MRLRLLGPLAALAAAVPAHAVDPFAVSNPAHIGELRSGYLDASIFLGNDFLPVKTLVNNDKWLNGYDPKSGRNLAVASARIETGVEWNGLRLGYIARQEWFARADRDSLDVYRAQSLAQPLTAGRSYRVDYSMEGFSAQGVQAGSAWSRPLGDSGWTLDLGASFSLLQGDRVRREDWQGSLQAIASNMLLANATVSRDYDHMSKDLLRSPVDLPRPAAGRGYAVDIGFSLGRDDGLRLDWAMADALGRLSWKGVPSETLVVDSSVICRQLDAACVAAKKAYEDPTKLPGGKQAAPRDLSMRLPAKQTITLSVPVNQANVEIGDSIREGEHFPRLGVRQRLAGGWGTLLDYDFRLRSVGIALAHRWLFLNFQTDSLQVDKAKVLALGLGVRIPF